MAGIAMTMVLVFATGFCIGYAMRELKSQRRRKSVQDITDISFRRNICVKA